jgi:hypothetical protein
VRATAEHGYWRQRVVRFEGPDFPMLKGLTFAVTRPAWRDDLADLLAILGTAGTGAHGPGRDPATAR